MNHIRMPSTDKWPGLNGKSVSSSIHDRAKPILGLKHYQTGCTTNKKTINYHNDNLNNLAYHAAYSFDSLADKTVSARPLEYIARYRL